MTNYTQYYSTRQTPQIQPIPGKGQIKNNAGGYGWKVDKWKQLDRFLILGAEGSTYYVNQQQLVVDNANSVMQCIKQDGVKVVDRIVEISDGGRAAKNDPALFVLAMCIGFGDLETRKSAYQALNKVARIPTHLFSFLEYLKAFKGWSRGLRNAVSNWYYNNDSLAYHLVKYQQRNSWSHRDVLRLAHTKPQTDLQKVLFHYAVNGWESVGETEHPEKELQIVWAFEKTKRSDSEKEIVDLILHYGLTREMLPTKFLNSVNVWEALLEKMPLTAMIRNLGKMSSVGLLEFGSSANQKVIERLNNREYLHKSRIHPLNVLVAMKTYAQSHGVKGSLTWEPVTQILDALDEAFYLAFDNVVPTGKRIMLALDVSGSMITQINNLPLSCRDASAALAMITARIEKNWMVTIFSSAGSNFMKSGNGNRYGKDGIGVLPISPRQRLDDIIKSVSGLPFSGTDCALPMLYAQQKKLNFDTFVIYTDNETWAGNIHPAQALSQYQNTSGINAKLVTVGMTSSQFSIADPSRDDMLDVVGFDTATPQLISSFIAE